MGNYISPNKGLRYSNDLDMSVSSKIEFKKIIDCVLPYVESLKQNGVRTDKEMIIQENISFKKIISSVLSLLTVLRGKK